MHMLRGGANHINEKQSNDGMMIGERNVFVFVFVFYDFSRRLEQEEKYRVRINEGPRPTHGGKCIIKQTHAGGGNEGTQKEEIPQKM